MKSLIFLGAVIGRAASFTPISAGTEERIKSSYSNLKKKLAHGELCPPSFSFDVSVLIDGTSEAAMLGDYWNDQLVPNLVKQMEIFFPGSRVAVSWFRDKPFEPVGAPTDTCFSMATDFTDSVDVLLDVAHARNFNGGSAPGGGDEMFNAQSQAILSAVQYSGLSWRESVLARPYGDPARTNVVKQVLLVTYTKSHNPGDGLKTVPKLPSMIDNTYIASGNPEELCREQDYPEISASIVNSINNYFTSFVALMPYNNSEVISYWKSIRSNVDPSDKGLFNIGLLVEDWESDLVEVFLLFINSAVKTCRQIFDTTSTPAPTVLTTVPWEPLTTTTRANVTSVDTTAPTTTKPETTFCTTCLDVKTTTTTTSTTPCGTCEDESTTEPQSTSGTSKTLIPSTAVHDCTGHGCCDGIEFRAHGKVKHVRMEFQWAERVKRLLSSLAW